MKLLVDMNLSPRWVGALAAAGIDATHWSTVGPLNAPDAQIMAHAAAHGLVVLTHDLDFGAILAATGDAKPSVVQIRADDPSPEAIGPRVIAALRQSEAELRQGALLAIDPGRARLRVLPLLPS
jgi:predicted nuclease of predicted toxin-antitoxin system